MVMRRCVVIQSQREDYLYAFFSMILLFTLPGRSARRARGRPPEAPRAARLCLRPVRVGASEPDSRRAARRDLEPVESAGNLEPGTPRRPHRFLSGG